MKKSMLRFSRFIWFLFIFIELIFYGCSQQVILKDHKIIAPGLYEANIPSDGWIQIPYAGGSQGPGFFLTNHIVSFRCPGEQMIGISKGWYQNRWQKGRSLVLSAEEFKRYFFEDYNENSGLTIQEILSTRTFQLAERTAMEFDYLVMGLPRLCTEHQVRESIARSKVIILGQGKSLNPLTFGHPEFIVFIFRSSLEQFDQSVAEFNQMVQSFKFTD
jgi:hypothetical protein